MKITEINSDELQVNENGIVQLIGGIVFALIGVAIGSWGFITQTSTNQWISLGFGAMFLLAGVAVALTAASRRIALRRTGVSEITTTKVITKKTTSQTFTTDQIASVNFETHTEYDRTTETDGSTREREQRVSSIRILLQDTTQIILATSRGGSGLSINGVDLSGLGRAPLYDEATRIATFYNVPLQTSMRNPSLAQGLSQVVSTAKQGMTPAPIRPNEITQPQVAVAQSEQQPTSLATPPIVAAVPASPVPVIANAAPVIATPPVAPIQNQSTGVDRSIQVPPRG